MMPSTTIMELWETFIGKTMKQPNIQRRMLLRAIPPKIEPEGWGDKCNPRYHCKFATKGT